MKWFAFISNSWHIFVCFWIIRFSVIYSRWPFDMNSKLRPQFWMYLRTYITHTDHPVLIYMYLFLKTHFIHSTVSHSNAVAIREFPISFRAACTQYVTWPNLLLSFTTRTAVTSETAIRALPSCALQHTLECAEILPHSTTSDSKGL